MSSQQRVFDEALAHMRAQGRLSVTRELGECLYRGEGGLRCAIGVLIREDTYTPELEGKSVGADQVFSALVPYAQQCSRGFLEEVQSRLHNELSTSRSRDIFSVRLETRARGLALDYGLFYAPPT